MTTVIAIALFALGIHLCMRTLAALYRALDLWYTIGTAWPRVARGIVAWGGATVLIAALLRGYQRSALLLGFAVYLGFYLAIATILSRVVVPRVAARVGAGHIG